MTTPTEAARAACADCAAGDPATRKEIATGLVMWFHSKSRSCRADTQREILLREGRIGPEGAVV